MAEQPKLSQPFHMGQLFQISHHICGLPLDSLHFFLVLRTQESDIVLQVPLDGIPSLRHVDHSILLCVMGTLANGTVDPTFYVIGKDIGPIALVPVWIPEGHHLSPMSFGTVTIDP
ncbi:hypothetical protein WISP_33051 [Willisornis vidua]|uniref:Uncharacterized protein n=1 Tax=Willisornis vidua TaxID=1566151 RepID=A0ABQ9DK77_9PASS|nr:hypothetical protein WISP_33051 [Willisornis vidua]